jgi:multimeric flavodoxin WrbA
MKVAVFLGSPRTKGNSELMFDEVVRSIEEEGNTVVSFRPDRMNISACINCGGCEEAGVCVFKDDMLKVNDAIRECERFVIVSPIFFSGFPAQVKAMIDRCQAFWCEKYLLKRPVPERENGRKGLLVLVGGMKGEIGQKCGGATAKAFFRTINVPEHEVLFYPEVDAKGAIKDHPSALKDVFEAGKKIVS